MNGAALRSPRGPSPAARWMGTRSPAERRVAVLLLVAVAAALFWATLWLPLTRDIAALRLARATNAAALAEARDRAKEASELSRTSSAVAMPEPRDDLDRVLAQLGFRPTVTSLEWREGRAHVVFAAINFDSLVNLLETLQRDAKLRAVEATITARVEPGNVRAELTLAR